MIFYYNSNGKPLRNEIEKVYQGSNKANDIYFVCPIDSTSIVSVAFTLPDGTNTQKYLMTLDTLDGIENISDADGLEYEVFKFSLPIAVTNTYGTVSVQFFISVGDETLISTALGKFSVEKGVEAIEASETEIYEDIMDYLHTVSSNIEYFEGVISPYEGFNLSNGDGTNSIKMSTCDASGENTVALGKNTVANYLSQTVIGQNNQTDSNAIFIIGNGSSASNKKNAFKVNFNGEAFVGANPLTDMSVANKKYVDDKVSASLASVYIYKGSVADYEHLPTQNLRVGDVYNVVATHGAVPEGTNYAWTGTTWDALGGNSTSISSQVYVEKQTNNGTLTNVYGYKGSNQVAVDLRNIPAKNAVPFYNNNLNIKTSVPVESTDCTNKAYVDGLVSSVSGGSGGSSSSSFMSNEVSFNYYGNNHDQLTTPNIRISYTGKFMGLVDLDFTAMDSMRYSVSGFVYFEQNYSRQFLRIMSFSGSLYGYAGVLFINNGDNTATISMTGLPMTNDITQFQVKKLFY